MLNAYASETGRLRSLSLPAPPPHSAVWFDLESPTTEEAALAAHETGLPLPSQANLDEIESSSRLSAAGSVLTLSLPIIVRAAEGLQSGICGFVLAPDRLITLRFAPSQLFQTLAAQPVQTGAPGEPHSAYIFVAILEAIADRQADALEALRAELDALSHKVFHHRFGTKTREDSLRRRGTEADLQAILVTLGRGYDTLSVLRDSQLGVARIAAYTQAAAVWLPPGIVARLNTVGKDIASLNEFSTHLTDKVQFLLDATLGLINIAQNSLIKVLTIVSIVGIPPTLIAGIYGMNFHNMPELSWAYGYEYGWAMMLLSAILPLLWFRKKGWL